MTECAERRALTRTISLFLVLSLCFSSFPVPANARDPGERDLILVSMGDSYSSGEGIDDFYGSDEELSMRVKNVDWVAHRSKNAWGGMLKLPGVTGKMSQNRGSHWFFVATSGAKTNHLTESFSKKYNKSVYMDYVVEPLATFSGKTEVPPQLDILDELRGQGKTVDYVTMTLGGNDAGFVQIIQSCVVGSTYLHLSSMHKKLRSTWKKFYADGGIRDSLEESYLLIAEKAPDAHIIVAGYPPLLSPKGLSISKEEASTINSNVHKFNEEIKDLVEECRKKIKISFVSVESGFDKHQAFTKNAYINPIYFGMKEQDLIDNRGALGSLSAPVSAYSMHPNLKGAKVYRDCVQKEIDALEKKRSEQLHDAEEPEQTENTGVSGIAADLAARWLSQMFLEESGLDGNAFICDFDKDGSPDWLFNFSAGDGRPMWLLVPANGRAEALYLRDMSAAGMSELKQSRSGEVIAVKTYSSAANGMRTCFPIGGEELAGYRYSMSDNFELEETYRVSGKDATKAQYDQAVEDLGLHDFTDPKPMEIVKTPDVPIPNETIPFVAEALKQCPIVTESQIGDYNQDGLADALLFADLAGGLPSGMTLLPVYAEEDLDDTIIWCSEGIIILSGKDGTASVTFGPAELIRQSPEYRQLVSDDTDDGQN